MRVKLFSKLINFLRLINLSKRLFLLLVIVLTSAVFIIGFIFHQTSKNIVVSETDRYLKDYILVLQSNIDDFMSDQLKSVNELVTNVEVINIVKNYDASNPAIQLSAVSTIGNELFRASSNISGFIGFDICTTSELVSYLQYRVTTGDINTSNIMQRIIKAPERITLFGTIPLEDPGTDYKYVLENGKGVVLGAKIKNHTNGQVVGMGILAFSESELYDVIYKGITTGNDEIYITDQNGVIISKNDKSLLGQQDIASITNTITEKYESNTDKAYSFKTEIDNSNYFVYYSISETTGWRIISLTNYDTLISDINGNYIASLFFTGGIAIIVFIFSVLVTKSITIPLNKITHAMHHTSIENKYPVVNVTGNDEISYLGDTFNIMSKRIQELIIEITEVHKKERQAEFKALQSQINPHFLYNTLDSINWLAYISGNLDICEIVNSLSRFFRLSLNKGNDFYTIADELNHLKCYINILKIKYRDSIDFTQDIDDECLRYKTIKILLQPIVENSVCHGIEPKGGKGKIHIKIYRQDHTIKMEVFDNGIGINEETQQEIEDSFKTNNNKKGYGMANIDERIKIYFGIHYGLSIERNQPCGTKVTIVIPAQLHSQQVGG